MYERTQKESWTGVRLPSPPLFFSIFKLLFQGNLVKVKGSPATVMAMPKPENLLERRTP